MPWKSTAGIDTGDGHCLIILASRENELKRNVDQVDQLAELIIWILVHELLHCKMDIYFTNIYCNLCARHCAKF